MIFVYLVLISLSRSEEVVENIVKDVLKNFGCQEEEAGLVAKEYIRVNPKLSLENFVEEVNLNGLSGFLKEWRRNLCQEITGFKVEPGLEYLQELSYEVLNQLRVGFEDLELGGNGENIGESELVCGDKESNSLYI